MGPSTPDFADARISPRARGRSRCPRQEFRPPARASAHRTTAVRLLNRTVISAPGATAHRAALVEPLDLRSGTAGSVVGDRAGRCAGRVPGRSPSPRSGASQSALATDPVRYSVPLPTLIGTMLTATTDHRPGGVRARRAGRPPTVPNGTNANGAVAPQLPEVCCVGQMGRDSAAGPPPLDPGRKGDAPLPRGHRPLAAMSSGSSGTRTATSGASGTATVRRRCGGQRAVRWGWRPTRFTTWGTSTRRARSPTTVTSSPSSEHWATPAPPSRSAPTRTCGRAQRTRHERRPRRSCEPRCPHSPSPRPHRPRDRPDGWPPESRQPPASPCSRPLLRTVCGLPA